MKITYEHQRYLGYYCLRVRMSLGDFRVERWFSYLEVNSFRPYVYRSILRGMRMTLIRTAKRGVTYGPISQKE